MFRHQKELQFEVKVDRPDPQLACQIQEVLGGQFGEMTVKMHSSMCIFFYVFKTISRIFSFFVK